MRFFVILRRDSAIYSQNKQLNCKFSASYRQVIYCPKICTLNKRRLTTEHTFYIMNAEVMYMKELEKLSDEDLNTVMQFIISLLQGNE